MIGILITIIAIVSLSLSNLSIDSNLVNSNLVDIGFNIRLISFTLIIFAIFLSFVLFQKKKEKKSGILLSLSSGLMFSINNLWTSLFSVLISHGFIDHPWKIVLFIVTIIMMGLIISFGTIVC